MIRAILLLLLLGVYISGADCGYYEGGKLSGHFLYVFQHVSLIHLLGNYLSFSSFYVILSRRIDSFIVLGSCYVCAVGASFFSEKEVPTVGCSGMVCALWGIYMVCSVGGYFGSLNWRKYWFYTGCSFVTFLICFLYSGINGLNHLVSLIMGMFIGLGVLCEWKISKK